MKFRIIIILLLKSCFAFELPRDHCNSDLKIHNDNFNVSHTYTVGDVNPTDAHYDVYGNLFYVESGRNDKGFFFNINMIKFKTTSVQRIEGLPEGLSYSIAIDHKNTKVYFGTSKGIYSYNYEHHNASPVSSSDLKLDMIFIDRNSNKYVTEHKNGLEELYRLEGDKKIRVGNIQSLNEMAIDDRNNFYYILGHELYVLKAFKTEPKWIGKVPYDGIAQISINEETVYVASNNLTYFRTNDTDNPKNVDNLPGKLTAVAFDGTGAFVLGVHGKIIKYEKKDCHFRKNKIDNIDQGTEKLNKNINNLDNSFNIKNNLQLLEPK